jgi:methylmalonyl-CoA/ethylmalonyl-CoA epimerase
LQWTAWCAGYRQVKNDMHSRLHHVGRVVTNINQELDRYRTMGCTVDSKVYLDEAHGVWVGKVITGGDTYIELLAPLSDASPISAFYKSGGGYHHICLEVEDLEAAAQELIAQGNFYLSYALPSVWNERSVCFLGTPQKDIIELITPISHESL